MTECSTQRLLFQAHQSRQVMAAFDGGWVTSDGGGLLLREVDRQFDILSAFVACFTDHRDPEAIEFSVPELLRQRVMGLALGYEDLNDHDRLRLDPLLALLAGRKDVTGEDRRDAQDRGKPLAGKSTLNRLELTPVGAEAESRYKKIVAHIDQLQDALVDVFIRLRAKQEVPQAEFVLRHLRRSWSSTSTPPMIRSTEISWASSFTGTTRTTVSCRCMPSVAAGHWPPFCGRPTSTPVRGRSINCSGSFPDCGQPGPMSVLSSGVTAPASAGLF